MRRVWKRGRLALRLTFVTVFGLVLAFPLIYLLLGSVMSTAQLTSFPPQIFPSGLHLGNFSAAWQYVQVRSVINSVVFTVAVVGLQWALCIMGGFALAKMQFRHKNLIMGSLGLSLFVPAVTTLVPTFIVAEKLHLVNTYPGLIIPIVAQTGFGTILFRQFIVSLPDELIAAARLDGAHWTTVLVRVVVPLAKPMSGAYCALAAVTAWNMYLWPLVVANTPSVQVLPQTLAPLASSTYGSQIPENVAFAATVITTLPMVVVFLIAQRSFVRGLAGSGVD
jgi:ABC-type glycerol-3-phosphate transport system permease component